MLIYMTMLLHFKKFVEDFIKLSKKAIRFIGRLVVGMHKPSFKRLLSVKNIIFINLLEGKINITCL